MRGPYAVGRTVGCVSEALQPASMTVPAQVARELTELRAENARLLRLHAWLKGGLPSSRSPKLTAQPRKPLSSSLVPVAVVSGRF
jgi:hypothetical protein